MANKNSSKFTCGCIISSGKYFFSSRIDALPQDEYGFGLLTLFKDGNFQFSTTDQIVDSICIDKNSGRNLLLAMPRFYPYIGIYNDDLVHIGDEEYTNKNENMVTMIKSIDKYIYVSCMNSDIYKRNLNKWSLFNSGLTNGDLGNNFSEDSFSLDDLTKMLDQVVNITAINGTKNIVYAATTSGDVFKNEGENWDKLPSASNNYLTCISFIDESNAYIVGHNSTLLLASPTGVQSLNSNIDDSFTSLTFFRNKLYLGGYKGIYTFENNTLTRIFDISKSDFKCISLDSSDKEMLITGERWFCVYDEKQWLRTMMPGNDDF